MTQIPDIEPKIPLGYSALLDETFSILKRHIVPIGIITLTLSGSISVLDILIVSATGNGMSSGVGTFLSLFTEMSIVGLSTAIITMLVYDAKQGRSLTPTHYAKVALSMIVPIIALSFFIAFAVGLAILLLFIPGLIIYAMYSVVIPVFLFEGNAKRSLARSKTLTKEYRWPIIALLGTLMLIGVGLYTLLYRTPLNGTALIVIETALQAFMTALHSIGAALIYVRLRQIEDSGDDSLAAVFD